MSDERYHDERRRAKNVNPYDLSSVFNAVKSKMKRKAPEFVNPYDCSGSAEHGKFEDDEG